MKSKDHRLLEEAYADVLKSPLTITFHANYNGWSVSNGDEGLENALAELGKKFFDQEGYAADFPTEADVALVVKHHFGKLKPFKYIIDEQSS